jgi:hypothetical protein
VRATRRNNNNDINNSGTTTQRAHLTPVVASVRPTTPASFQRAPGVSCQYGITS